MDAAYPVREGARSDTPLQLLSRGVEMLAGVTDDANATLASMKIETVLDLDPRYYAFGATCPDPLFMLPHFRGRIEIR